MSAEGYYLSWFERHLPADGVVCRAASMDYPGLSIAGPEGARAAARAHARRRLERGVPVPVVPQDGRRHDPGAGRPRQLHRRTRLRNLGPAGISARAAYAAARRPASRSGWPSSACARCSACGWRRASARGSREYRPIYGPYEAGLGRFVDLKKNDFVGRAAAAAEKQTRRQAAAGDLRGRGGRRRRDRRRADLARRPASSAGSPRAATAIASASRWRWATSRRTHAEAEAGFEIEIIGERRPAVRLAAPAYDPAGAAMRS